MEQRSPQNKAKMEVTRTRKVSALLIILSMTPSEKLT